MNFAKMCCALVVLGLCEASLADAWPTQEEIKQFFDNLSKPIAEIEAKLSQNPLLARAVLKETGATALHVAADLGSAEVIELLVTHGGDVNALKRNGASVLRCATNGYFFSGRQKDPRIVFLLLENGAVLDTQKVECSDSDHCALGVHNFGPFWEYGSVCGHDFSHRLSPAWNALKSDDNTTDWLRKLAVIRHPSENSIREIYRISAAQGHMERVRGMMERYGNMLRIEDDLQALFRAVARGRVQTCQLLLSNLCTREKKEAEKEAIREALRVVLRTATMSGYQQIVNLLVEAGAENDLAKQWQAAAFNAQTVHARIRANTVPLFRQRPAAPAGIDAARQAAAIDIAPPPRNFPASIWGAAASLIIN